LRVVRRVTLYTLRGCGYCVRAKALLDAKRIPYEERDVTSDLAERSRVKEFTGHPTFPQVLVDSVFVGGCDELLALDRAGDLERLLC